MPELPEVETVRRGLQALVAGETINAVDLRRPDLRFPLPDRFAERLAGRTITDIGRRAKYLLFELDDGHVMVSHLGMSGSFRIGEPAAPEGQVGLGTRYFGAGKATVHDHVVLDLGSGRSLIYNDPRRFGFMELLAGHDLESRRFGNLGPEPTRGNLTSGLLAARIAGRTTSIKTALLDQRIVAGLGNIYVCEALWRARISPARPSGDLVTARGRPGAALSRLVPAIHDVLEEAIDLGGSSLRDHINVAGEIGDFQSRFAVYDREDKPCPRDGCYGTVERFVQGGRSTFLCARCQR